MTEAKNEEDKEKQKTAGDFTTDANANDADDDDKFTAAEKLANAKKAAQEKVALEQKKVEPLRKKYGNYLASWTRMDLFPSMTRENIYPRTAMERTQRRDFLGKGMGKVYPFGLKNKHQMSGAGGNSSDLIKLRRLYGRAKYWKKRDWEF